MSEIFDWAQSKPYSNLKCHFLILQNITGLQKYKRKQVSTSKYAFWDANFKLVIFKNKRLRKNFDISPKCLKGISIEDLLQVGDIIIDKYSLI